MHKESIFNCSENTQNHQLGMGGGLLLCVDSNCVG